MTSKETKQTSPRRGKTKARVRLGVALLALLALLAGGLIAWSVRDGDNGSDGAEIVSVESLLETAVLQPTPIYWVGPRAGARLELSRPEDGRTYVRYLTDDAEAGDPDPDFLTVGTYVQADPVTTLRRQGRGPTAVLATAPGGGTVYFDRLHPHSAYLAYPGDEVEVEVYDPEFKQVLRLVRAGQVVPVVGKPKAGGAP